MATGSLLFKNTVLQLDPICYAPEDHWQCFKKKMRKRDPNIIPYDLKLGKSLGDKQGVSWREMGLVDRVGQTPLSQVRGIYS